MFAQFMALLLSQLALQSRPAEMPVVAEALKAQKVLTVTAESKPGKHYKLYVNVGEAADVKSIDYVTFNDGDARAQGSTHYTQEELNRGVILAKTDDGATIILTLRNHSLDYRQGGTLELGYLFEGGLVRDDYKSMAFDAIRDGQNWKLQTNGHERKDFNKMHFVTHRKWSWGKQREVGIARIDTSFQAEL